MNRQSWKMSVVKELHTGDWLIVLSFYEYLLTLLHVIPHQVGW